MALQRIQVVGSSAASNFATNKQDHSWPHLLSQHFGNMAKVDVVVRPGLTPIRAIDELLHLNNCDLLILHLGTSVGWPSTIVDFGYRLGIDFESEHGLHQPAFRSKKFHRRVKAQFKARLRNSAKYLLFFTGMYRPRINLAELDEQVNALIDLAFQKAPHVIWIQHRAIPHRRIFLERMISTRFYNRLLSALSKRESESLKVIFEEREFLVKENYLIDFVHLSENGHFELFKKIAEAVNSFEN